MDDLNSHLRQSQKELAAISASILREASRRGLFVGRLTEAEAQITHAQLRQWLPQIISGEELDITFDPESEDSLEPKPPTID